MKGIILAAGRGSRLKKLTDDRPKCLVEIGGLSLLEWQLAALKSADIKEIFIITGYHSEMLQTFGFTTIHNSRWEKTNMVHSFLSAKKEFTDSVIVTYSDIVYDSENVKMLMAEPADRDIVIAYDKKWRKLWEARFKDPASDAESFKIDTNGIIHEIGKKGSPLDEIHGQYMGLMRFSEKGLSWICELTNKLPEEVLDKLDMTSLLQKLIVAGYPMYGMPITGNWCEVDSENDVVIANNLYKK